MAYNPSPLFDALESKLAASGFVSLTKIGEPTDPPPDKMGVVMFNGCTVTELTLSKGSGTVNFILRFYFNALAEPKGQIEKDLARTCLEIMDDLAGDFDLGDASVRNIVPLSNTVTPGFQTVAGKMYRMADMAVEVLVNDIVTHTK